MKIIYSKFRLNPIRKIELFVSTGLSHFKVDTPFMPLNFAQPGAALAGFPGLHTAILVAQSGVA
ncbi:MAG: hypothetical protein ACE5JS_14930 [Nitrospinota bacterium]